MRRRDFLGVLGGTAAVWPLAARGQDKVPVVGYLSSVSASGYPHFVAAFREGVRETGFVEGKSVAIEYRFADGQYDRLPVLAADLVRRQVAVIGATGGAVSGLAAKSATPTIPIVFTSGSDPVEFGLVSSLNRPEGNVTGISLFGGELQAKRLELLRELVPGAAVIGLLMNPTNANAASELKEMQAVARVGGWRLHGVTATNETEIDFAFRTLVEQRTAALQVGTDAFFISRRSQIVTLAAEHKIPAVYILREFPAAGGLMSYGAQIADAYRQAGVYVGRILKGAKPSDLPVLQPSKYELVINLKAAKALGLTVPPTLLARADEVIE
jgi:putative ABC transport system substrate-binding protein